MPRGITAVSAPTLMQIKQEKLLFFRVFCACIQSCRNCMKNQKNLIKGKENTRIFPEKDRGFAYAAGQAISARRPGMSRITTVAPCTSMRPALARRLRMREKVSGWMDSREAMRCLLVERQMLGD